MDDDAPTRRSRMERPQLPHGAKGYDFGVCRLIPLADKLVFSLGDPERHWTFHAGPMSHVFDIHETRTNPDGSKTYRSLFSISHQKLEQVVWEVGSPVVDSILGALRPLRIGWMARKGLGVVVQLGSEESETLAVTTKRRGFLRFSVRGMAKHLPRIEFLDELYDLEDGRSFLMYSFHNSGAPTAVGMGFKFADRHGESRLTWIKLRDLERMIRGLGPKLVEAARRLGEVAPEEDWQPLVARR